MLLRLVFGIPVACSPNRQLMIAGLEKQGSNLNSQPMMVRLERKVADKLLMKKLQSVGPTRPLPGDAEPYAKELNRLEVLVLEPLFDDSARLRIERWFFLGVLFALLLWLVNYGQNLILCGLLAWVAKSFFVLARENNSDLQVKERERLETVLTFVRLKMAVQMRDRAEINTALKELTLRHRNPLLSREQTTPELERQRLIQAKPGPWRLPFRRPSEHSKLRRDSIRE